MCLFFKRFYAHLYQWQNWEKLIWKQWPSKKKTRKRSSPLSSSLLQKHVIHQFIENSYFEFDRSSACIWAIQSIGKIRKMRTFENMLKYAICDYVRNIIKYLPTSQYPNCVVHKNECECVSVHAWRIFETVDGCSGSVGGRWYNYRKGRTNYCVQKARKHTKPKFYAHRRSHIHTHMHAINNND